MPVIVLGLGGVGSGIVRRLKKSLVQNRYYNTLVSQDQIIFCSLDVDKGYDSDIGQNIDIIQEFFTKNPQRVIDANKTDEKFLSWWIPKHKIYDAIEGQSGAGQIRINGRLAFFDNYVKIRDFLSDKIQRASKVSTNVRQSGGTDEDARIRIFIVSSIAGGTGAGILVDTVHLIRSLAEENTRIYGILLDGSIFERLITQDPYMPSIATLIEIEKWMEDPKKFEMFYGRETIKQDKDTFLNIAFIIQFTNMKSQCFKASPEEAKKNYQTLVAMFLESVVTIKDYNRFFEANDWNRFDVCPKTPKGRSCRYASFAVSQISFPTEKVINYCFARLISEKIKDGFEIQIPDFIGIQKELEICEQDGNQLTNLLRKLSSALKFSERIRNVINGFQDKDINSKEKFSNLYNECQLSNLGVFDKLIESYKTEMYKKLEELKKKFTTKVEEEIFNRISTLKFEDIKNMLNEFNGSIQNNQKHVTEDKKLWSQKDQLRNKLKDSYDAILKCKTGIFGIGNEFYSKKQEFIDLFNQWSRAELEAAEKEYMSNFYESLKKNLENLKWAVEYLNGIFSTFIDDCAQDKGKYVDRDWIVSPERKEDQDYLLNMEISIKKSIIDREIFSNLLGKIDDNIKNLIEVGISEQFDGLKKIFSDIYEEYCKNPEKEAPVFNTDDKKSNIRKKIVTMFEKSIKNLVNDEVMKIGLSDALEWYLQNIYDEITKCKDNASKENLKRRYRLIFGDDVNPLFNETKDYDKWCNLATSKLVKHVYSLTKPFIQINESELKKIWEENPDVPNLLETKTLFIPSNFKRAQALADLRPVETEFNDKISIVTQLNFFPLHTLLIPREKVERYEKHASKFAENIKEGKEGGLPYHADVRFYTIWRDNINISDAEHKPHEREAELLFLLGLGFEIIKRDKQLFRVYNIKGKVETSKRGIDGMFDAIKNKDKDIAGLANIIYDKFLRIVSQPNKLQLIKDIFKKAYEVLKDIKIEKPKKGEEPTPTYKRWDRLLKLSKVDMSGAAIGELIPRDNKEIEQMSNDLQNIKDKK